MTIYQWLCLLGAPALIAAVFKYLHSLVKKNATDTAAVKAGLQALLRAQMINDYNKWEFPEWSQPLGAHDAYNLGDKVSHNGKKWVSTAANNVWEPGVYGWEEVV